MQEQNASPINLMLLLALSYLLHKSNITQLGIFSIQLLIIEIRQSFPHSNNRIIQINRCDVFCSSNSIKFRTIRLFISIKDFNLSIKQKINCSCKYNNSSLIIQ